jgi:Tol biopolymer transport system component
VRRLSLLVLLTLVTVGWASSSVHVTKATGTLAFVRGGDAVYVVRADGSGLRRLTTRKRSPHEHLVEPAWSPDGRKVAYSSDLQRAGDTAYFDLFVMNADGSGQRRLTRTPQNEFVFSWSPDGRRLAFFRFPVKPSWAFFVMNADGTGVRKVNWSLPGRKR